MKGANLRPVPVQPNPQDDSAPAGLSVDDIASTSAQGADDLDALPAAQPPPAPGAPTGSTQPKDADLDSLPDAGGTLGKVYDSVSHLNPDRAADVISAAQKTGQPEEFVAKNFDAAKKAADGPSGNFFQSVEERYPGTTKFLSDPRNMARAHDDVPNIAQHENMTTAITHATSLLDAWNAGLQNSVLGLKARQKLPSIDLAPDAGITQRLVEQAGQLAGDFPAMFAGGAAGAETGGSIGATVGGFAGAPFAGVGAIPGAAAGGAAGVVIGGGAGAFAAPAAIRTYLRQRFQQGNVQDLEDLLNRTGEIMKEATKQGLVGAATAATGGVVNPLVARSAAPAIVKTLAPLVAETAAMTYAGKGVEGQLASPMDLLEGALMVGAMHGVTHLVGATGSHIVQEVKAEQARDFYDGLADAATKSKLLARSPEAYANMLGGLAKDTPVSDVYIPAEKFNEYFQSKNLDPALVAEQLGVADQHAESQVTGGDIKIPLETWTSNTVKSEHFLALRDDIKFDPEGLTNNEVAQRQAEIKDAVTKTAAARQAEIDANGGEAPEEQTPEQQDLAHQESAQKVYDDTKSQLLATGKYTDEQAETNARVQQALFRSVGSRAGLDPLDLYSQYRLRIGAGSLPAESEFSQSQPMDNAPEADTPIKHDRTKDLTDDQKVREKHFARQMNHPSIDERYAAHPESFGGKVISQDLYREMLPGYAESKASRAENLKTTNNVTKAKFNQEIEKRLAEIPTGPVLITAGGPGSGKTAALKGPLAEQVNHADFAIDNVMASKDEAVKKIDAIRETGRAAHIAFVFRPLPEAAEAALDRYKGTGRPVPADVLVNGHVKALETALQLDKHYINDDGVSFQFFVNEGKGEIRKINIEDLDALRYAQKGESANDAVKRLLPDIAERLKNGEEEIRKTHAEEAAAAAVGRDAPQERSDEKGNSRSYDQGSAVQPSSKGNLLAPRQSPLGFVSQLENEVAKMDFKEMPAKDLANRIKNLGGIKAEELEHTGIIEFLNAREGKISKPEVEQFLKDNGVKIEQTVLSKDYVSPEQEHANAETDWGDPERDYNNSSEDINDELDNNLSDKSWVQERKDELRPDYIDDHTDEDGNIDEDALDSALQEKVEKDAAASAEEYVNSDDYYGARFDVKDNVTGWKLNGSDELGWYSYDLRKHFDENLEETKVQLIPHMIAAGDLAGAVADYIKPKDIEWKKGTPVETPNQGAVTRKMNALFKKEKARFLQLGREDNDYMFGDNAADYTEKEKKEAVEKDALHFARKEVEESYADHTNPKNNVEFSLNHALLKGSITGNDSKGYTFELRGKTSGGATPVENFPLESKSIDGAKAEVIKLLQEKGKISKDEPKPEAGDEPAKDVNEPSGRTKFAQYTEPGGENYREILLTTPNPGKKPFEYSGHFAGHENILAHVRVTDRVDSAGRKTLVIDEMQSDWHQQGRERGYALNGSEEAKVQDRMAALDKIMEPLDPESEEFMKAYREWDELRNKVEAKNTVPDAPFKNTDAWAGLAIKRMLRMAVEQGYEALSWMPAKTHVDRWGTDNISWNKTADGEFKVGSVEQRGGRAGGTDIEDLARIRGELLEKNGETVKTKDDLRKVIGDTLNRERNDRSLDSLTDTIWKEMQEKPTGEKNPRAEGMQFFYDKVVPKAATAIIKKLDPAAKLEVTKFDTSATDDGENAGDHKVEALEIPITDAMKEKVQQGLTLFQPGEDGSSPRGKIQIAPNRQIHISLLKDMDLSTFLHETGHFYMEVMGDLAHAENAPDQIKDDYQKILGWLGVGSREEIQTEHHEKWARGFENYLMDGKAPSEALANVFGRIRTWLVNIYRNVKALQVELSPEIRGVMDRMLATDDEIKAAARETGYTGDVPEGVEPKVRAKIKTLEERARQTAETTLLKQQMQETTAKHQEFLAGERDRLTKEATEQVNKIPVFEAGNELKVLAGTRKTPADLAEKFLAGKAKDDVATHFEELALRYDFQDGKDLANQIKSARDSDLFNKEVKARVDAGMAKYPDLMNDKAALKAEALKAIHNDKSTELLALERQVYADMRNKKEIRDEVVGRKRNEARIDAETAKATAKSILDAKPVKDASRAQVYVTAERNAAVKATKAAVKGDFEAAAAAKQQQMLNHALAAEAMRNSDELEKKLDYLNGAAKRGRDLQDMPYAFNRQVDQLLQKFGLKERSPENVDTLTAIAKDMQSKGETASDIANATGMKLDQTGAWAPETLTDFIARVNNDYTGIIIPQSVLSSMKDDYKNLTMQELRDLTESVKTITNVGKKYDRFLNDFIKITMKEAASALKNSILEKIGAPYAKNKVIGSQYSSPLREKVANLANIPDGMISTMVNTLTVCHYLDGGPEGPAHDYIYRPLKHAEDRKFARYAKMREKISGENGLMAQFYKPGELSEYKKSTFYPETNSYLSKEQILSMALNWGNEGNRERIRAGFGSRDGSGKLTPMSDETIQSLFKNLDKRDWDFAQATWNHLETYWPEIAALEMKVRGVEAKQVDASEFTNQHGTYAGGYYPIAYDFEKSSEAFKNDQAKTELFKQYSTAAAHTDTGHTQARVSNVTRPVRLSLDVLFNHLENVAHDLEFRPAVIDVNKFLNMPDAKSALENSIGPSAKRGLDDWLKAQGSDQGENLTWLDKAFQWTRFGTTISALGLTPKAFLLHLPSNMFQAAREIGPLQATSVMTRAALDAMLGRGELKDFVFEKSERMNQRLTVRDRDIMDMARAWTDDGSLKGKISAAIPHFAFMSLHLADEAISVPLWAEVYKQNVAELGEQRAVDLADETVTRRLGSGSKVDQIGAQRGSGAKKLFTMFYSWESVMFNNAWLDGKMAGLEYQRGNVGKAAAVMAHAFVWGFALPAIHDALLREALRNSQSGTDDKDRAKRVAGNLLEAPFAQVLFARDLAPPIIHKLLGEQGGDYKMSPVEMAFQNIYSPLADGARLAFTDKPYDEKYAEEAARGMSQVAGYPQQLNTWAFNFLDYVENNGEASMKDFLSRRQKK